MNKDNGIQLPQYHTWSRLHPQCKRCGTQETKHRGGGLCYTCYYKVYRDKHPELIKKAMRRWLDKRKGRFTYEEEKVSESTKMVFRAVDASYYIHVNEKKLYPRKIWIVNFLLSFVVAYLFMVSALDFSYFGCYFTSDIPNQCTLWPGLTNIVIALVINIVLALVVPYWILMLLSDWVYDLGKKTESELMRQTVKTLEQDGSIDAKCAEVVTNGIMSMHWSPSERMMAAINTSNDNNKDG